MYAGRGNDYVDTAIGNDVIYGEDGEDQIIAGVVTVGFGQSDNDLVYGGGGRDRIRSYAGDDFLVGGTGMMTLTGAKVPM